MSENQAIWTFDLSGLILVQAICNVYQKTALVLSINRKEESFRIILL